MSACKIIPLLLLDYVLYVHLTQDLKWGLIMAYNTSHTKLVIQQQTWKYVDCCQIES